MKLFTESNRTLEAPALADPGFWTAGERVALGCRICLMDSRVIGVNGELTTRGINPS